MEKRLSIMNLTSVSIDVYRSEFSSVSLSTDEHFNCDTEESMCVHGHSQSGSFAITKNGAQYSFKSWGKLTMNTNQSKDMFSIQILEKK